MSEPTSPAADPRNPLSSEEMQSALFAQMVVQQTNLAMMLLGRVPHPETGEPARNLDAAKLFIDQLEMLEVKTRGNLNRQESALLKQSLMTLRLAFVEEVNRPETPASPAPAGGADAPPPLAESKAASGQVPDAADEAEAKKRFSKKY